MTAHQGPVTSDTTLPSQSAQQAKSWPTTANPSSTTPTRAGLPRDLLAFSATLSPWEKYEFATNVVDQSAKLVVMSMAWLTSLPVEEMKLQPGQPALETVSYWLQRFSPLVEASKASGEDITVIFCNRVGNEKNETTELVTKAGQVIPLGESVSYAGSSCVMLFSGGEVSILDMMGKGEEGLLVVDTDEVSLRLSESQLLSRGLTVDKPAKYALRLKPTNAPDESEDSS
jgi:hypothetical protein